MMAPSAKKKERDKVQEARLRDEEKKRGYVPRDGVSSQSRLRNHARNV